MEYVSVNERLFMKGQWVIDLLLRTLDNSISRREAIQFMIARLRPKPLDFTLQKVKYENADHTIWGLAAEIILGRHYCPAGFDVGTNDIVLDIGAHRGVFVAYSATRSQNTILAVEPNKQNFEILKRFVSLNDWKNVTLVNKAVGSKNGYIKLFTSRQSTRHSITGFDPVSKQELITWDVVEMIPLMEAIDGLETVDLLKMDCEGAEFEILTSCGPEIFDRIKRITLEIHDIGHPGKPEELCTHLRTYYKNVSYREGYHSHLGYIYASN
jgi:FkbM family methyltransferase